MSRHTFSEPVELAIVQAKVFPQDIQTAHDTIKEKFPNQGPVFGVSKPENGIIRYFAGVQIQPGTKLPPGVTSFQIAKGMYETTLVKNFRQNVQAVGTTFDKLTSLPNLDPTSWCIEWYKGEDVICMVKINE